MRFPGLILLIGILCSCTIAAQPVFDLAHLNGIIMPVRVKDSTNPDSLKPEIRNLHAFLQVPLVLSQKNSLLISPYFEQKSFAFPLLPEGEQASPFLPADFSCYALTITNRHTFADSSWRLFTAISVRHYGETGMMPAAANITTAGAAFVEKRFNGDLSLRAGLFLSREFFGNLWLPLAGFNWRASDRLWCWGLLPRFAVADYRVNNWWHMCLHFRGINESYLYLARTDRHGWLALQEGQLRLAQEFYLPKTPLVFSVDAGHTVNRTMRAYDPGSAKEVKIKPTNGVLVRMSLVWRLRMDERFGKPDL